MSDLEHAYHIGDKFIVSDWDVCMFTACGDSTYALVSLSGGEVRQSPMKLDRPFTLEKISQLSKFSVIPK